MAEPKVSVIIFIHNSFDSIHLMMDYLMNQSLDDIEIVLTGCSLSSNIYQMIDDYYKKFQNPVKIVDIDYTEYEKHGIFIAIKYVIGRYIYLCDTNGAIPYQALEKMFETATQYQCDIILGWIWHVTKTGKKKVHVLQKNEVFPGDAMIIPAYYWGKLFKRDFLINLLQSKCLKIKFEDTSVVPVLISYAQKMQYIEQCVYIYNDFSDAKQMEYHKRVSIEQQVLFIEQAYFLCNESYKDYMDYCIALWLGKIYNELWIHRDFIHEYCKKIWGRLCNNTLILCNSDLHSFFENICSRPAGRLTNNIYIDGFNKEIFKEEVAFLRESCFNNKATVVVLSDENCDIDELPIVREAYEEHDYKFVYQYFALKRIFLSGGILFDQDIIKLMKPLNYLTYYDGFFSFIGADEYSGNILGSGPNSEVIQDLLDTYNRGVYATKKPITLAKRIKMCLTAKYGVKLNGETQEFLNGRFVALDPTFLVYINDYGKNMCVHDFSKLFNDDDFIVIHKSFFSSIYIANNQCNNWNYDKPASIELQEIKNSDSWKLVLKLKAFANTRCGSLGKSFFKWILEVYRRFKHIE